MDAQPKLATSQSHVGQAEAPQLSPVDADADARADASSSEADDSPSLPHDAAGGEGGAKRSTSKRGEKSDKHAAGAQTGRGEPPFGSHFSAGRVNVKRMGFSAGAIVAGRVAEVTDSALKVDLFGKAIGFLARGDAPTPGEDVSEDGSPSAALSIDAPSQSTDGEPIHAEQGHVDAVHDDHRSDDADYEEHALDESVEGADEASADAASESAPSSPKLSSEQLEKVKRDIDHDLGWARAFVDGGDTPSLDTPSPDIGHLIQARVVAVAESGHLALSNRKFDVQRSRELIEQAREHRLQVPGFIYGFNRGGFDVLVGGVRAFCPASLLTLERIENPESFVGHVQGFLVSMRSTAGKKLVVGRRTLLLREARKRARERVHELKVGERVTGKVREVRPYGVVVDLGGVDGLIHHTELAYERVRPADVALPGQDIEAVVTQIDTSKSRDRGGRISLSRKALLEDPWNKHAALLRVGLPLTGKVRGVPDFGAFVEVAPGIDGLVPVSEFELVHLEKPSVGDVLAVAIENVDRKARRVSLSLLGDSERKAFEALRDTAQAEGADYAERLGTAPKPGSRIEVEITWVGRGGARVRIPGVFGRRGRAELAGKDLGNDVRLGKGGTHDMGSKLEVKVVSVERDGAPRFSRSALLQDEERAAVKDYKRESSKRGFGTFGDLLKNKV